MRQRFELYINGRRADLDGDAAPVLFNYTAEELRNPAIVKNSYSRQLTLPGTAANGFIFQSYFRLDAAPAAGFDPSKRVPFAIYADGGRVVVSGYAKLDSVSRTGGAVSYHVTLFGGLGGFLYSLQYNADGTRTLADLLFVDGSGDPLDLGFTINRQTVAEAWANMGSDASKWRVVNFAPCYNGIPENFDAGRAIIKAAAYGLEETAEEGGKTYGARNGFAGVDLPGDLTEWQVKDLRSYLQRPVISVPGIFRAICQPGNNGGYNVVLDPAFFSDGNKHYSKAWMTLRQLTGIKLPVTTTTENVGSMSGPIGPAHLYALGLGPGEKIITVKASPTLFLYDTSVVAAGVATFHWGSENQSLINKIVCNGVFLQAVAYDADGNAVAGSKVVACTADANFGQGDTAAEFAAKTGFTPVYSYGDGEQFGAIFKGRFARDGGEGSGRAYWSEALASLEIVTTAPVASVQVIATKVQYTQNGGSDPWETLWTSPTDIETDVPVTTAFFDSQLEYTYTSQANVGSGAQISQAMLLSDTMSPAEFLLSYCKRYGLLIRVEEARKVVHIEARPTAYEDETVVDISGLVDRSREVSIVPVPFTTEKLEFREEPAGAAYSEEYKAKYGLEYGAKRLNTGYEFNAEIAQLFEGSKFKSAPEVKARNLEFLTVRNAVAPTILPAVFLHSGLKYHLFAADNRETNEMDVPAVPSSAVLEYWSRTYKTYDVYSRLQLCNKDGKGIDGDGVLIFSQGTYELPAGFALSDDEPAMYLGNNANPCWILEADSVYNPGALLSVPLFGRFSYSPTGRTRGEIYDMQEFSTPLEIDIPGVRIARDMNVYNAAWRDYIQDRYSPATKVLTAYIYADRIHGFGPAALRRFFYIDGAVWVLNKISDYDLNGDGLTKCEFVQVQDAENYRTIYFD